jgi:hypothetical protein
MGNLSTLRVAVVFAVSLTALTAAVPHGGKRDSH